MKKLFLNGTLLLFAISMLAQSNDPAAKKVLDDVSAKFKTYKTVQATFNYKVEDANGKVMSTKAGTIWMKGTKYKVAFGGQEIYSDGKTVWNYDKSAKEVTINNVDAAGNGITPQKLFTNFYEIEMTPTDKSKNFHKVYLQVDKGAKTIYSTKVLEKTGNRYTYTVTAMKTNVAMDDGIFGFDKKKYPGVTETDLR